MLRVGGLLALCLMVLALPAQAQRDRDDDLVLLGQKTVGFLVDRDIIKINQSEDWFRNRAFRSLHFAAERNDLHLISIRLVYLNGYKEDLKVDRTIRAGRQLPVDLRGERSYLREIEMVYRSRPSFRGQAVIKVYGEPAPRPIRPPRFEPPKNWELLGEKSVGFRVDRDVINVKHPENWFRDRGFRMLHFVVEDNEVHPHRVLQQVHGNHQGQPRCSSWRPRCGRSSGRPKLSAPDRNGLPGRAEPARQCNRQGLRRARPEGAALTAA